MRWLPDEGYLGEEVVICGSWVIGARVVLCCAGSAMGLSLVELSWSDAGGALRPLIASSVTRTARRRSFSAELMMLNRSARSRRE